MELSNGLQPLVLFSLFRFLQCAVAEISPYCRGDRPEVVSFEAHDVTRAGQLFGDAWLHRAVVNSKSGNPVAFPYNTQGFQYYDTWSKAILSNVTFRNFRNSLTTGDPYSDNTGLIGMTHSDTFKPQNLAAGIGLRWENFDDSQRVGLRAQDTGSSRYYSLVDFDGSISGNNDGSYILGSATATWWNYDNACVRRADWNVYVCPKGDKEVGVLSPAIDGYIDGSQAQNIYVGNTTLWGRNVPSGSTSTLTRSAGVTGPTNVGWYTKFDLGAPLDINITVNQVPQPGCVYYAQRYPAGTSFTIWGSNPYFRSKNTYYSAASSISDLWASNGTKYYFDNTHLFLKLNNPWNTRSNFTRAGAYVWTPDSGYHWIVRVTANCASSGGWCTTPVSDVVPGSGSWWN